MEQAVLQGTSCLIRIEGLGTCEGAPANILFQKSLAKTLASLITSSIITGDYKDNKLEGNQKKSQESNLRQECEI